MSPAQRPSPGELLEVAVSVDGEAAEAVCELFERHGAGAVVEVLVCEGPETGAALPVPRTRVATYLPADDTARRHRLELGLWHLGQLYPVPEPEVRRLREADWAEAWKAHYAAQRIGPFDVVPSWLSGPDGPPAPHLIRLDPGMAFGTGLHPTTRLCLVGLAELVRPGQSLLDVGTGSGILAIAGARLGAAPVLGLDVDARAIEAAGENAARNGVDLALWHGTLEGLAPGQFDLVAANLLAGLLQTLAPELAARTRPGGRLLASGVLAEQAPAVDGALVAAGFEPSELRHSGDWVALIASRRARA